MENTSGGILGRLGEKVLGWVALGLLIALGVAIYQMEPTTRAAIWAGIWRTAAWIVISAALPWVTRLFITRLLELGSNWAGVILLVVLGLMNAVAGVILMRGFPSGGWAWVAALAGLAVVCTYNYLVTEYLSEQAGG